MQRENCPRAISLTYVPARLAAVPSSARLLRTHNVCFEASQQVSQRLSGVASRRWLSFCAGATTPTFGFWTRGGSIISNDYKEERQRPDHQPKQSKTKLENIPAIFLGKEASH